MEKNVTEFIIDDMEQSNTIEELKSYYIDVSNWFVGNVMLGVDKDELGEYYDISVKYQFDYLALLSYRLVVASTFFHRGFYAWILFCEYQVLVQLN